MTINRFFYYLALFFFLMMLVIPTIHQFERGLLLVFLLMGLFIHLLIYKNWRVNNGLAFVGLLCLLTSVFFIFMGVVNGNHAVLIIVPVYVVWPMFFLFVAGAFNHPRYWDGFFKTIIVGSIAVSILGFLAAAEALGYLDFGLLAFLGEGTRMAVSQGNVGFTTPSLATLIYALPFLLAIIMLPKEVIHLKTWWLIFVWIGFLSTIIIMVMSGRRAFWLSAALSPFIIIIISILCRVKVNLKNNFIGLGLILLLVIGTLVFLDVTFDDIWTDFVSGFDFSNYKKEDVFTRKLQFDALLHGWMNSPIIGAGHGAGAIEFIRNPEAPFDYELSYMSLLFHTGLLGFLIYSSSVIWLFFRSVKLVRKLPCAAEMLIPTLTGLACFLIANTSNPYLEKFDYLWTLFLPVAILNAYLMNTNSLKISSP